MRRGGREVECAALEMRYTGNRIVGSNPTLSATGLSGLIKVGPESGVRLKKTVVSPSCVVRADPSLAEGIWGEDLIGLGVLDADG